MKQTTLVSTLFFVSALLGCQRHTPQARYNSVDNLNPAVIAQIQYRGLASITQSDVLNRLTETGVSLGFGQVDPGQIKKAQVAIEELLSERGHKSAVVKPTYERIPGTDAVRLVFTVDEGRQSK